MQKFTFIFNPSMFDLISMLFFFSQLLRKVKRILHRCSIIKHFYPFHSFDCLFVDFLKFVKRKRFSVSIDSSKCNGHKRWLMEWTERFLLNIFRLDLSKRFGTSKIKYWINPETNRVEWKRSDREDVSASIDAMH